MVPLKVRAVNSVDARENKPLSLDLGLTVVSHLEEGGEGRVSPEVGHGVALVTPAGDDGQLAGTVRVRARLPCGRARWEGIERLNDLMLADI